MSALTITRKQGERVHIGDNVVVEICKVHTGRKVSLRITAPEQVRILREELKQAEEQEKSEKGKKS